MKRAEAEVLEQRLMEVIVRRRSLGGYSPDAADLVLFAEILYEIVRQMRETLPAPVAKKRRR